MSPAERAGILLGSAGLALSLYNTWRLWWNDRPRIRVEVQRRPAGLNTEAMLRVQVANHGRRTVPVARVGLVRGRRRQLWLGLWGPMGSNADPFDLEPGRSRSMVVAERSVTETLEAEGCRGAVKVRGGCWDQLGKLYRSKPIAVEVEVSPLSERTKNA